MVVGVDVSSRRVDLAWLENDRPCRWHQELGGPKTHLIDRLRSIEIRWPRVGGMEWVPGANLGYDRGPVQDVTDIAIEMPFGQSRKSVAALSAVVGIVTRQAPPWARVAWPSSGELRAAIGARNNKGDAHDCIHWEVCGLDDDPMKHDCVLGGWGPDELDALVACIGWTRILEANDA